MRAKSVGSVAAAADGVEKGSSRAFGRKGSWWARRGSGLAVWAAVTSWDLRNARTRAQTKGEGRGLRTARNGGSGNRFRVTRAGAGRGCAVCSVHTRTAASSLEECGEDSEPLGEGMGAPTRHAAPTTRQETKCKKGRSQRGQDAAGRSRTQQDAAGCRSVAQFRRPQKRSCYPHAHIHPRSWDVETHVPAGIVRARMRANEPSLHTGTNPLPLLAAGAVRTALPPMSSQSQSRRELASKAARGQWVVSGIVHSTNIKHVSDRSALSRGGPRTDEPRSIVVF